MSGLRETIRRRGGLELTSRVVGGLWVVGQRTVPEKPSPYNAAATAALKAAFPDLWNTLMRFGFDNPDKVPFINQYPLVAPYLLVDGLAFMVDCQYECSAALWKDLIGAVEFAGSNIELTDGVPTLNGTSSYMYANFNPDWYYYDKTIEIVFECGKSASQVLFSSGYTKTATNNQEHPIAVMINSQNNRVGNYGYANAKEPTTGFKDVSGLMNELNTISMARIDGWRNSEEMLKYNNYVDFSQNANTGSYIGCRNIGSRSLYYQGKIYAIRIYNRLLTEQEILANQAIDLQRWQAS